MVTFSKKTLCLALCALAAGNAMAEDWWGGSAYWNSASVSVDGEGSEAYASTGPWRGRFADGTAATVSVASAFANDDVQRSNTISAPGGVAEGLGGRSMAYGYAEGQEVQASTGNYHGGTYSYTDTDAEGYFNYEGDTKAEGDSDFYADGYGEDIVGAMGGEASVAIAQESRDKRGRLTGGAAGITVGRSKGRQGKDDWHSAAELMRVDNWLDHETTGEFITGARLAMQAGIGLSGALP